MRPEAGSSHSGVLSQERETNAAWAERLVAQRDRLYSYCMTLTEWSDEAEDLCQETLTRALAAEQLYRNHGNERALLFRIAKNARIDQVRRCKADAFDSFPDIPAQTVSDSTELETAIKVLLQHVSPLQSSVFLLREGFALTAPEVARLLNTSEGAVKAALHRARTALRQLRTSLPETEWVKEEDAPMQKDVVRAYLKAIQDGDVQRLVKLAEQGFLRPTQTQLAA